MFLLGFVVAGGVAIASFVGVDRAMEPFSSDEYCIQCHEMQDVHDSWAESPHHTNPSGVQVTCVECHLPPRERYTDHLSAKAKVGAKDCWVHQFGEYDAASARQHVLNTLQDDWCIHCHSNLLAMPSSQQVAAVHESALKLGRAGGHACVGCHDTLHGPKCAEPKPKSYDMADNSYCLVCHINFEREEFTVTHKRADIGCEECHGPSDAHGSHEDHIIAPDTMYAKEDLNESCMTAECHAKADLEEEIGHRPFFAGTEPDRKYCTDCHGMHSIPERHRKWDRETRELIFRDGYSTGTGGGDMM